MFAQGDLKIDQQTRGTRILFGEPASEKRRLVYRWSEFCERNGFSEIELPSLEPSSVYTDKAGDEVLGQMYTFSDKKGRELCLRPEGTATCQLLAQKFKFDKDVRLFYTTRCWRYERPQEGRYREFTQFGVEILNPTSDPREELIWLSRQLLGMVLSEEEFSLNDGVVRGLGYYTSKGWEAECPVLGAQKQVLGGGAYAEGVGFAIGVDRVVLAMKKTT